MNLDRIIIKKQYDKMDSSPDLRASHNDMRAENDLAIYEDIKIFDYAHKGFLKLRHHDGVTSKMIKKSLNPTPNFGSAKKAGESTGKSGSFFFFSFDKKFIIKTMFDHELDIFMEHIEDYFLHFHEHPNSLMARIYGIF